MTQPTRGVRRKVTFQAWCNQCLGWKGPERQYKGDAAFDSATHQVDKHGGSYRQEATTS